MQNRGLTLQPSAVMADFELALIQAVELQFPSTTIHLNRLARKAHPNLYETIELIKNEQASTEVQMIQLAAGGQARPKKKKSC